MHSLLSQRAEQHSSVPELKIDPDVRVAGHGNDVAEDAVTIYDLEGGGSIPPTAVFVPNFVSPIRPPSSLVILLKIGITLLPALATHCVDSSQWSHSLFTSVILRDGVWNTAGIEQNVIAIHYMY